MRTQNRLVGVVAAAILLVSGAAVFLLERDVAPPLPNPVEAADRRETSEPDPSASDRQSNRSEKSEESTGSKAAPEAEPPARTEEIDEALSVDLALLDAMTRKPRNDAAVWYIDPEAETTDRRRFWHQSDALVEHCGIALDLDAEAHVRLPDFAEVEVVARAPDRFARVTIRRSNGERQRLLLWPDSPLKVRVVDAKGQPGGELPVVLDVVDLSDARQERSQDSLLSPDLRREELWRGTTSKSYGEAEVSHGARLLVAWSDPDLVARSTALRFRLALPTTEKTTALVDPQMDLHQPVVLVAPALVRLRVFVVGPDDRPYPYEVRLTSRLAATDAEDHQDDPIDPLARLVASRQSNSSAARAARAKISRTEALTGDAVSKGEEPIEMLVPAGDLVEIEAEPADAQFRPAKSRVTAPSNSDVVGEVMLKVVPKSATATAKRWPRVLGRALDPDGRPLRDERLGWQKVDPHRRELIHLPEQFVRADHGGCFVIPFPQPVHGRSVTIRLFAPCPAAESGLDATMSAEVALGDPDRQTDLDLGDVPLQRLPLLIAGRVVDPNGSGLPHPGVWLWAGRSRPNDLPDATIVAGSRGRFVLHGDPGESSLFVTAELDGWYLPGTTIGARGELDVPKLKVPVGSSDVTIELHRCGVARGELLLDSSVEPSAISLESLPRPPGARVVREEENRFRLVGIPGLCDLVVRGSGRCLLTVIDRIELREAATTNDSRIEPLDMTGIVRMPVLVVDPGGKPIPAATLALSSNSEGVAATRAFHADPFGREVIVAVKNFGPLVVLSPGLRLTRVPLESIEKTIRLPPGIRVTASLQGVTDAPPKVVATLTARYMPARGDVPSEAALLPDFYARSAPTPLGGARFEIDVCAPGSYWLEVGLSDPARGKEGFLYVEPRIVTVADARETQHFELQVPEESLRRGLQMLER